MSLYKTRIPPQPVGSAGSKIQIKNILFVGFLFFLVFGLGVFVGKTYGMFRYIGGTAEKVDIVKVLDLQSKTRSDSVAFDQFWNVWNLVKKNHLNQPVNEVDLFYGSIKGLVAGLNDPYSVYMPPTDAEEFARDFSQEFEGIGAEIGIEDGIPVIVAAMPGSPAEKAGLQSKDLILSINGEDAYGFTIQDAVKRIKGEKGTEVLLVVARGKEKKIKEVKIIRDVITVPTVIAEMKDNGIGYIRITIFNGETWSEFSKKTDELLAQKPKAMILDMRSNPGGLLATAIQVASEWVEDGIIVKEKFNSGEVETYKTEGKHRFKDMNTVVLVDTGSASGSEIVAGALQDHKAATVMGVQTYGKGSVQDFQVFPDGSALKLTIAHWFTPLDQQIDKNGITPDILVDPLFEEEPAKSPDAPVTYKDLGIQKAIEFLLGQ